MTSRVHDRADAESDRIVVAVPMSAPDPCVAIRDLAGDIACALTPEP